MSQRPDSIHIWAPGIRDDTGGIQAFSRFFVRAIREEFPNRPIRVITKNEDVRADDPLLSAGIEVTSLDRIPAAMRSYAMAGSGIWHGLRERPACTLSTHLHFFTALRALRTMTGIPYGGVLHGIEAWKIRSPARVRALLDADRILSVSRFTRDRVVANHGIDPARVSVVPNTYDATRFKPGPKPAHLLERYRLKADQPVLLTVSRLALSERYKGHWQVLIALRWIREAFPNVHYLIAGTGDEVNHLRTAVRALGLDANVTFAGFVSAAELPDHYRLCDAFVMPSTKEGFGIVFLEAAACGKPVIAGDLDGSTDALDEGRLGILADPYHPAQIADAVVAALNRSHPNPLLFQPEALSQAVAQRFGFDSFKRQVSAEVSALLEKGRPIIRTRAPTAPQRDTRQAAPQTSRAPRIVVLTQLSSPYQVEFFNQVALAGDCHLEVVYLTSRDKSRKWVPPDIAHSHLILSETPRLKRHALEALLNADLAVFNYYTHVFASRAIRERARSGRPWVFWGERPGFLQLGPPGMWFRRLALKPLHRSRVPIWGVGQFGIEGYRIEFGRGHPYRNVPYYSDLERFHVPRAANAGVRTILYSGGLNHRKGVDLLARAFAGVARDNPSLRLCIVGDGPLKPQMQTLLASCADRVEWAGFQPWHDLPKFYARGDVFCFPSRYDGWGLALVEALASGLPAIATDQTGAAIDLIAPGRNGWLVKADDPVGLCNALREAVAIPPGKLGAMQAAARESVEGQSVAEGARKFNGAAREVIAGWPELTTDGGTGC